MRGFLLPGANMAIDLATLGFGVETADLERAAKILDAVTESADKAGKAAKGMASDATSGMDGFTSSSQKASQAAQQYLQSLQKQYDMLGKNRMETAALQAAYMGFNSEVQKQAAAIGAQIDAWHRNEEAAKAAAKAQDAAFRGSKPGADEAAGFMAKLGLNTAGASREMIVLAHEALTGNFSRIPGSLMVLTERMGSLHSIIGALLSPIGLVSAAGVAAFAGITYEIIKTEEEIKKLNIAMSATGNFAGMSEKQFTAVSESISGMGLASTSAAKEIETGLVMSGKYSADIIGKMTLAISQYSAVTGEETDKASSQLTRMFEDPVKAANVLDDQFHIMTYTDRLYVEQLVKVGDQQDAVRFTLDKLSAQLQGPAADSVSNITRLWREFGSVFDEMQGRLHRQSEIVKIRDANPSLNLSYAQAESIYESDRKMSASSAQRDGERQQAEQQAKNNALFLHGESEKYRTAEKLRDDYAKNIRARETADTAAVMNMTLAQLKAYDDKLIANYDAKHKDKKGPRQKVDVGQRTADNYMAGLVSEAASAQQEINNIIAGIDFTKLTKGEKQINDLRAQLAISDPKMRNGQRSNSSIQEEIAYLEKEVVPLQKKLMLLTQHKEVNAVLTSGYNKLNAETVKYIDGLQSEVDLIGATSLQRKEAAVMLDMEAKERQLVNEAAKAAKLNDEDFRRENKDVVAGIHDRVQAMKEQRLQALASHEATMNEFSTGWDNAMAAYKDKAANNATAAANIFNAMTTNMESTLLNFFNTGKMGWQDFAKSVLVEIEKIMIAKQAAGLVGSISLGGVMQWASNLIGGQTQAAAPIESGVASWTATQANGGAWSRGVQLYANGGVFDRPTAFAHAGGLGVLGEAGPEAVMPLTRGADGKLGVKASGQGGGGDVVIQQTFYIQQDGTVKQTGDAGQYQQVTQQMADAMTGIARQSIVKAMLPGGEIATVYGNKL